MMTITQIKTFAKRQLRGNKLAAAGAMILVFICTMLWCSAMFSVVFVGIIGPSTGRFVIPELVGNERLQLLFNVGTGIIIASLLFLGIYLYSGLMLGSQKLYLSIAKGRRVSSFEVFKGFADGAQLKHYFSVVLIIYFIQFLIMVPETVIAIISGKSSSDYRITSGITTFITYIVALFLSMSCFASADHPEMGAWKAIGVSLHLMRKRKFKFMCLELSFLGWFVLVVITFGLAGFWIIPYFDTSLSIFYLSAYGQDYISTPKDVYVRGDAKPDPVKPSGAEAVADAVKPSAAEALTAQSSEAETEKALNGKRSFEEVRSQFTDFGNAEADTSVEESLEDSNEAADLSKDEGNSSAESNLDEVNESSDYSRDEVSASEANTEEPQEEDVKKSYNTEEDAYAAYVQWKKDHGITIDNPDPFHNIHHKDNGKDNAGGNE